RLSHSQAHSERRTRLVLAVGAVTNRQEYRFAYEAVADLATLTTAFRGDHKWHVATSPLRCCRHLSLEVHSEQILTTSSAPHARAPSVRFAPLDRAGSSSRRGASTAILLIDWRPDQHVEYRSPLWGEHVSTPRWIAID